MRVLTDRRQCDESGSLVPQVGRGAAEFAGVLLLAAQRFLESSLNRLLELV